MGTNMDSINAASTSVQHTASGSASSSTTQTAAQTTAQTTQNNSKNDTAAVYEKSSNSSNKYQPDTKTIEKIKAEVANQTESLRNLVAKLFEKQGATWNDAYGYILGDGSQMVEIDAETRKKAQEMVSEDGYFGVEQTSQRLLDFAKALSGGDPSKIEKLREAVQKGFDEAEKKWGGKLPEISQKTYDATMEKFDAWAKEFEGIGV